MKIEKNIAPPPPKARKQRGVYKGLAEQMEVGDSAVCSKAESISLRAALKKAGFTHASAPEGDQVRVWKLAVGV